MADHEDDESMRQEMEEVEAAEERLRSMAEELRLALKAAHRLILGARDDAFPTHIWNNEWPIVDRVVNRLDEEGL